MNFADPQENPDNGPVSGRLSLILGAAIVDGSGVVVPPGGNMGAAVLVRVEGQEVTLLATGPTPDVLRHAAAGDLEREGWVMRPGAVLLPAMVNAHAHLDLTHIGARRHDPARGFVEWVGMVRAERARDEVTTRVAVQAGLALSARGGVVAIGDICGAVEGVPRDWAARELAAHVPMGVSFVEFFGLGAGLGGGLGGGPERARAGLEATGLKWGEELGRGEVRVSLSPHAPYSVGRDGFGLAGYLAGSNAARRAAVCTHLAECAEERQLVTRGDGPFAELLKGIGIWNEEIAATFGRDRSPVARVLGGGGGVGGDPWLTAGDIVVHCNDVDDEDMALLMKAKVHVVFCPRASAYFGAAAHFGPHRYREMLEAGVNVALGTDSIINLPEHEATGSGARIGVLDEMRLLARRDGVDATTVLAMGLGRGARALGLDEKMFGLSDPGGAGERVRRISGVVSVDARLEAHVSRAAVLEAVVKGDGAVSMVEPVWA